MKLESKIYKILKNLEVDMIISCPSINLDYLLELIEDKQEISHIPVSREDDGLAIAVGANIGGKTPVLIMNRNGIKNIIRAFTILCNLYDTPVIILACPFFNDTQLNDEKDKILDHFFDVMSIKKFEVNTLKEIKMIEDAFDFYLKERSSILVSLKRKIWRD